MDRIAAGLISGGLQNTDYKPQTIEIYYLPTRDWHKLDNLSDEDYDAQRESAYPVWVGVI